MSQRFQWLTQKAPGGAGVMLGNAEKNSVTRSNPSNSRASPCLVALGISKNNNNDKKR
jgi:hypothetical protein